MQSVIHFYTLYVCMYILFARTFSRLDDNWARKVYGLLEGGGHSKGRDLQVALQDAELAAGAVGRQLSEGEDASSTVLETKYVGDASTWSAVFLWNRIYTYNITKRCK